VKRGDVVTIALSDDDGKPLSALVDLELITIAPVWDITSP
jgi:hypothetical protein